MSATDGGPSAPQGIEESSLARPHRALRDLVATYVGYCHDLDPRAVHHGLPGPSATVVLAFDEPLDVAWLDRPEAGTRRWRLASGMHVGPALIRTHGRQHGIQLALTPAGSRALLGLPIGELAQQLVGHDDLPLGLGRDEHERLSSASSWPERFALLDLALLRMLRRSERVTGPRPEVAEAWRVLSTASGRVSPAAVAAHVGLSRRHLGACFASEYGLTLQQAGGLLRFDHGRRLAARGLPLVQVAMRAGYADQAHLSREWRRFAGLTPTETLGDPFRIVQDNAEAESPD